jgi:glycerate-2-kinase
MLLHRLLVRSGAGIAEINCVRKHLSQIKGGQLARAARRGRVMSLILSDVIGDAPDVIASGPTAPDTSTFSDALAVVERHGLGQQLPPALLQYLREGAAGSHPETPKPGDAIFANVSNRVIGNNQTALEACQKKAMELGFESRIVTNTLSGDAGLAAKRVLEEAHSGSSRTCLLFGGETTVKVTGDGLGGRCQHLALAAALELAQGTGITLLAAGTDGSDGPTDAAGAVVDCGTRAEARKVGLDAAEFLGRFDSYHFFKQTGGHVKSGPTRTNVMDIVIVLTAEKHA